MKQQLGVILLGLGIASSLDAQDVADFEVKLWEMKIPVADALEKRLAGGGDAAAEAMANMPNLIKRGTVKEREAISFKAKSGERGKQGPELWVGDSKPKPAGVAVEYDVVLSPTKMMASMNWYFERHEAWEGKVSRTDLTNAVSMETSKHTLLQRIDQGRDAQLLVAIAESDGAKGEPETTNNVWVRGDLFKMRSEGDAQAIIALAEKDASAALAKAKADGELIIGFAELSQGGQRSQIRRELMSVGGKKSQSFAFQVEPTGARGRVSLSGEMVFHGLEKKLGETLLTGEVNSKVVSGGVVLVPCVPDRGKPETPYVFALSGTLFGPSAKLEPEVKVVAAKRPQNRAEIALYVATYQAPPDTMHVWAKRFNLQRKSGRDLCEAGGVNFIEGASVFFNPSTCSMVARLDEANHAKLAELINSVIE